MMIVWVLTSSLSLMRPPAAQIDFRLTAKIVPNHHIEGTIAPLSPPPSTAEHARPGSTPATESSPTCLWGNPVERINAQMLDDRNEEWFYPRAILPPQMSAHDSPSNCALSFHTKLGRRLGVLNGTRFHTTALSGWHPYLQKLSSHTQSNPALTWHYEIEVPAHHYGWIAGRWIVARPKPSTVRGRWLGHTVPAWVGAKAHRWQYDNLSILTLTGPGLQDIPQRHEEQILLKLRQTFQAAQKYLIRQGLKPEPTLVIRHHRVHSLAERFEGGLSISRRALQLPPLKRLQGLHQARLWRVFFEHQAATVLRATRTPESHLLVDVFALCFREHFMKSQNAHSESAADMLRSIAVIPELDNLVFAPQIPYRDAYYEALDEHTWPPTQVTKLFLSEQFNTSGKLLYTRLRDAVGLQQLFEAAQHTYQSLQTHPSHRYRDVDAWALFEQALQRSIRTQDAVWMRPQTAVDYRVDTATLKYSSAETKPADLPSSSGAHPLRIDVIADADPSAHLLDPIEIEIVDANRQRHRAQRIGPGPVVFESLDTGTSIKKVILDPDQKLQERRLKPGTNPRANNVYPEPWKVLLTNVSSLFAVTQQDLLVNVDFALRPTYRPQKRIGFGASYDRDYVATRLSYSRGFGRWLDALRTAERASLSLRARQFFDTQTNGRELGVSIAYRYDDRLANYWAYTGRGLFASVGGGIAGPDGQVRPYGDIKVSGLHIQKLGASQSLAMRLRLEKQWGDVPDQIQLALGGRDLGARGYEPEEAFSDSRLLATVEHRHIYAAATRSALGRWLTVTRLEGAFFANASYFPVQRPGCQQDWFYDVGYGFRTHQDLLSLAPNTLQIDIGVPLNRCADSPYQSPLTVYISFWQSLSRF